LTTLDLSKSWNFQGLKLMSINILNSFWVALTTCSICA